MLFYVPVILNPGTPCQDDKGEVSMWPGSPRQSWDGKEKDKEKVRKIYSRIIGTGGYLPSKILTNADLEKMVNTSDEWITERTGIHNRHIMAEHETSTSMAEIAARRALEAAGIAKDKIGLIIVATVTPESLFPNTASRIQHSLGINEHATCPAFDINAACCGFICALSIADQYLRSGAIEYALIVGVESLTKFVDWTDRTTCVLFSDGAGAAVLKADNEPGVYSTHLHTDGRYADSIHLSGSTYSNVEPRYLRMRGNEVFKIAVNRLGEIVDEALAFNNFAKSDIDWLIPHQANLRIIQATAKKLNIPMERVILTIEDQGNTSAASVPLALDIGIRDGRIKHGDLMLLEAFGAGVIWGSALVRY
jgi:3-oxoacyl-[acyl-carrier-protein] synthase III